MQILSLILENVKQSKDYLKKIGLDPAKSPEYLKIRDMLSGNDGYTYWFVKQHFGNKVPMAELENIWNIFQNERSTVLKFEKPFSKLENVEEFWDEYYKQKNLSKSRTAYNKFKKEQRDLLDFNDEETRKLLDGLADRKDADETFYNKSSRYHTTKDLKNAISIFLSGKTDKEFGKLLNSLESDNQDIIYQNESNSIIITRVDYDSIKKWGGDTSWCIVGSKHTFDSYNSQPMSQQFIIFLTDEPGIKSKIGVTTNINGYNTAHYKNDGYCSQKDLTEILDNRGVMFSILLPSKESLLEHPKWNPFAVKNLKDIGFTMEEIAERKNIFSSNDLTNMNSEEVRKYILDWNPYSVDVLIKTGLSKKEILSKKTLYNTEGTKGDLSHFTRDEIEKYELLDKTTLYPPDLKSYSSEEIEKRNLWKRLSISSLSQLTELRLDYGLLKKISNTIKKDFLAGYISASKNRESAIKNIHNSHWLSYVDSEKKHHSASSKETNGLKLDLVRLLDIQESEMTNKYLYDIVNGSIRDYDKSIGKLKMSISTMESFGRKIDDSLLLIMVSENTSYNGWIITLSEMIKSNIKIEWSSEKLKTLIKSAQSKLSGTRRNFFDEELRYFEMKMDQMSNVKRNLKDYEELYQQIYDISRSIMSENPQKLKDDKDVSKTLKNMDFYSVKPNLKDFFGLFTWVGISNLDKLLKYLKERGYDLSDEETLLKYSEEIRDTRDSKIDILTTMIKSGLAVKQNYERLIKWVEEQTSPIDKYDRNKLEDIFKKEDQYYKKWKELHSLDTMNKALSSTLATAGWWSRTYKEYELTPEKWFEAHWDVLKDISWEDQCDNRRDYEQKYFLAFLQLLAKLGKKKELDSIENFSLIKGANYSNEGFKNLCKIISDKLITNSDRTYRKVELTEKERKLLFEWLNKQFEKTISKESEDPKSRGWGHAYSMMAPSWYVYDKPKFWRYVDEVTKLKGNVTVEDYRTGEVKKRTTVRLKELDRTLIFLAEEGYWDDLEKILKMFGELKMSKTEYDQSIDSLKWRRIRYPRSQEDREKGLYTSANQKLERESTEKLWELVRKYIKPPTDRPKKIKESRILGWGDYNLKFSSIR